MASTSSHRALRCFALVLAALLFAADSASAAASLIGSSVTGNLQFSPQGSVNYFDAVNGLVPAGFLNSSPNTPTVIVASPPPVEFGFVNQAQDAISADLDATTLTLTEKLGSGSFFNQHLVFTDPAFAGLSMLQTTDTFGNGGLTSSLAGDTLTIDWGGEIVIGTKTFKGVSTFSGFTTGGGGSSAPLPAGAWAGLLLAIGVLWPTVRRKLIAA